MLAMRECRQFEELTDRLHNANGLDPDLLNAIVRIACGSRLPPGFSNKRLERLIEAGAWADVALTLIEFELPAWHMRRLAYDEGEWHCALSQERELPDWLDDAIETHHADLALAILSAFVEARRITEPLPQTSVPVVKARIFDLYDPLPAEHFF